MLEEKVIKDPEIAYTNNWTSGWTTTKVVDVNSTPYLLHYKRGKGTARSHAIGYLSDGKITTNMTNGMNTTWPSGWTVFEPFKYEGATYHIAHKSGSGTTHINKYANGVPRKIWEAKWSTG